MPSLGYLCSNSKSGTIAESLKPVTVHVFEVSQLSRLGEESRRNVLLMLRGPGQADSSRSLRNAVTSVKCLVGMSLEMLRCMRGSLPLAINDGKRQRNEFSPPLPPDLWTTQTSLCSNSCPGFFLASLQSGRFAADAASRVSGARLLLLCWVSPSCCESFCHR